MTIPTGFMLCPNCNGNSSPMPEHPSLCGGLVCPVCNGLCDVCDGVGIVPTPWTQDDLQRVLFNVLTCKEEADQHMGGDSEHLRDAYRIAEQTLIDNRHWPEDKPRRWS